MPKGAENSGNLEITLEWVRRFLRAWDPLDLMEIESVPEDEYDMYAPTIARLLSQGCDEHRLAEHLGRLRTVMFELDPDPEDDRILAQILLRHRLS